MKLLRILSAGAALVMSLAILSGDEYKIRKVEIKQGAIECIKIQDVTQILVKDDKIASARSSGPDEIIVSARSIGKTGIFCKNKAGDTTALEVSVLPRSWDTLQALFADAPEITLEISGDNVILSGETVDSRTLQKIEKAMSFENGLVINNVTFSPKGLSSNLNTFIKANGYSDAEAKVLGTDVYLSGQVFDDDRKKSLISMTESYTKPFGCKINADGLNKYRQKIFIHIEFIKVEKKLAENLGVTLASPMAYSTNIGAISSAIHGSTEALQDSMKAITIKGNINALKENTKVKTLYATTLSTQSGEKVEFQAGGTMNKQIYSQYNTGIQQIEYGYMVKALPVILDKDQIIVDFNVELKIPKPSSDFSTQQSDLDIAKYSTASKYTVKPGESIIISGFNNWVDEDRKSGIPFFSTFPYVGTLFGNDNETKESKEILLVFTVDWEIDNQAEIKAKTSKLRNENATPEIP